MAFMDIGGIFGNTKNVQHIKCAKISSMKATNITIKVESGLAHEAKVFAARHGVSLSRLVAEQLEKLVREDQAFMAARRRALHGLKKGFDLAWEAPASREELHDRESLR